MNTQQPSPRKHIHRLLALGALTRGDRRAATIVDFSTMNLETRDGGRALRILQEYVKAVAEEELENLVQFAKEQGQAIADVDVSTLWVACGLCGRSARLD